MVRTGWNHVEIWSEPDHWSRGTKLFEPFGLQNQIVQTIWCSDQFEPVRKPSQTRSTRVQPVLFLSSYREFSKQVDSLSRCQPRRVHVFSLSEGGGRIGSKPVRSRTKWFGPYGLATQMVRTIEQLYSKSPTQCTAAVTHSRTFCTAFQS